MNIFRFFDRKPHTTAPVELPVPERFQQTLKARSSQKFQVEAKTLDEYRQRSWAEDESANLSSHLERLRSLQSVDNTPADLDARPGHVVSKDRKTEYHPDTGELTKVRDAGTPYSQVRKATIRTYSGGTTVQDGNATLQIDNQGGAVIELHSDTLRRRASELSDRLPYRNQDPRNWSPEGLHDQFSHLKAQGSFEVSPDGKTLPLPTAARSIDEADANEHRKRTAKRAETILSSVLLWDQQCQDFDGKPEDRNSDQGGVVVPHASGRALEETLSKSQLLTLDRAAGGLNLERTTDGFLVADCGFDDSHIARGLSGQVGDKKVKGNLFSSDGCETVEWDREKGTLTYQKVTLLASAPRELDEIDLMFPYAENS